MRRKKRLLRKEKQVYDVRVGMEEGSGYMIVVDKEVDDYYSYCCCYDCYSKESKRMGYTAVDLCLYC